MTTPHLHRAERLIVMSEVDVAQIHFSALVRFMDRGLSEWLAAIGHPFLWVLEHGPGIPIVNVSLDIGKRIHLDDVIAVTTSVGAFGRSSFKSRHVFERNGEEVARGELTHVCVNRETRESIPAPEWLREHEAFPKET